MSFALLAIFALAGCASNANKQGTMHVQVTDLPGSIGDFRYLNVTVTSIELTMDDGSRSSHTPSAPTFDLTKLTNGNLTTLFKDDVKAGNYSKLALKVADATGVLKSGGQVSVKAPSGTLFLNQHFEVEAGEETTFVFDIVVHMQGNGSYMFQPNASGSRVT